MTKTEKKKKSGKRPNGYCIRNVDFLFVELHAREYKIMKEEENKKDKVEKEESEKT